MDRWEGIERLYSEEELERRGKAASQSSSGTPVSSD